MPVTFCPRCGHHADKHSGSLGCIGTNGPGEDCHCTQTYQNVVSTAPAVVTPKKEQR